VRRADNLATFMCRLSRNLGTPTSWNPKGLSRPVVVLLYLYHYISKMTNEEMSSERNTVEFFLDFELLNNFEDKH
jgi:hypothetical protein